jgi:hypothetical protein
MQYRQAKSFLLKLPILVETKNIFLLKEISKVLELVMFLPNDYIIYKVFLYSNIISSTVVNFIY